MPHLSLLFRLFDKVRISCQYIVSVLVLPSILVVHGLLTSLQVGSVEAAFLVHCSRLALSGGILRAVVLNQEVETRKLGLGLLLSPSE